MRHTIQGFICDLHIVCTTKKEASKLLDISMYELTNYGYCYEPKTEECIKNKFLMYVIFSHGEMIYANNNLLKKAIKLEEAKQWISEYRKVVFSYKMTMDIYNEKNKISY